MIEKYFTVEQVSVMLNMHPKTIQRYIREGKLRAIKIGKGWRVTGHDLSVFTEKEETAVSSNNAMKKTTGEDRVRVSSVIDIRVDDMEDAVRINNALTAVLNSKPPEYGLSSMHTQYLEHESKVRITLWGGIHFMEAIIGSIAVLAEPPGEE